MSTDATTRHPTSTSLVTPPAPTPTTTTPVPVRGLAALLDCLLTQVGPDEAADYRHVADQRGGGLVISGQAAPSAARKLKDSGFRAPLLLDAQRYKGARRSVGAAGMDPRTGERQLAAGATVPLSDSGYIPAGDHAALDWVLAAASGAAVPTIALLPLATRWVTDLASRQYLSERIVASKVEAVAIVLEHADDPLGVRAALVGVLALVSLPTKVLVLRSDGSAIGLLAYGAHAAAVGVRTSLRHLYPLKDGGGGMTASGEAAYFTAGMSFLQVDKLALGIARDPADPRWSCLCTDHAGANLANMLTWNERQIRQHSAAALIREQRDLTTLPRWQRAAAWHARVSSALSTYEEIANDGIPWRPPRALRHWGDV